jgi:hypothetical protein
MFSSIFVFFLFPIADQMQNALIYYVIFFILLSVCTVATAVTVMPTYCDMVFANDSYPYSETSFCFNYMNTHEKLSV